MECFWLCVTIRFQNSTCHRLNQHCGWFSLQTGIQSDGEETCQNPGRYPNINQVSKHIFLRYPWWIILFHTSRQWEWVRRTNPWTIRTISIKCGARGSEWGTTILENKCERIYEIDGSTTSCSMNGIWANARIRVEQDVDLVLKNMKLEKLGQPHDEVPITTDPQYKH